MRFIYFTECGCFSPSVHFFGGHSSGGTWLFFWERLFLGACAIEDLVWDEVVLNRGVEQIVPDGALPTPDLPNRSSISFEKTCKTM